MTPKSRWGTPPGLVFGANMAAFWDHLGGDFGPFLDLDLGPILFTFFTILETLLD